jgi:hypothetical protein
MWTYDLAREQVPSLDHLRTFCRLSLDSGYNALGLYMEHRFAYPSTPWSHGTGAVTPEMVRALRREFPELGLIPFVNLLGHSEGMLYTEEGHRYAEERFKGMQACPSKPEFVEMARGIVEDALEIFDAEIVHIGGDETWQLGCCERCTERVREWEEEEGVDGKARLYGEHFGPLAQRVKEAGRRPGVWGDMFFDHPQALKHLPAETIVFDWQYFKGPQETSRIFHEAGFEVVYSPTLHTYNATWLHLPQSEANVRDHAQAARESGAYGVCVTTWENALMGNYETLMPAIRAAGRILAGDHTSHPSHMSHGTDETDGTYASLRDAPIFLKAYLEEGEAYETWARAMGIDLQDAGGTFAFGGIRSSLKVRLLLNSNPFLAWMHHREELSGEVAERALETIDRALAMAPNAAARGVSEFARGAIEFVQLAERAHLAYAAGDTGEALTALTPTRQIFENLEKVARATHLRIGGSLADIERCRAAKEHVERVIRRVRDYGDRSLGYLPSFEAITHPKFVPHDQANWWLINRWANE